MKKNIIVVLVVAVVLIVGVIFISKGRLPTKAPVKKPVAGAPAKVDKAKAPALVKKTFSKDMGGLTVKIMDSKNRDLSLRIRAFKVVDSRSSAFVAAFTSNKMQELAPGTYDLEIDAIPQRIYKNVKVSKGAETIEDLGCITGSLNVKALNAKKKDASYPVRILYPNSKIIVTAATTNRPVEIMPGVYDVEIGTLPMQTKKNVKIEGGRENPLDLGLTVGTLVVKAQDQNKKDLRYNVKIMKSENNELVSSTLTNRSIEVLQGSYNIEVGSTPKKTKQDVKVTAGEEASAEFLIEVPVAQPQPPAKTSKK